MAVLRFFMLLSLVIWIGGIIFFAAAVAPTAFGVLPTHDLAGLVVRRSLTTLHWTGVTCGGVFIILSLFHAYFGYGDAQPAATRNVLVFAMVVFTLVSQTMVMPRMDALRLQMGEIDSVALNDPRRLAFDHLHGWSTRLEVVVLLLGLATLFVIAREWAIPLASGGISRLKSAGKV